METLLAFSDHFHLPGLSKHTYTSGRIVFDDRRAGAAAVSGAGNLKCKG